MPIQTTTQLSTTQLVFAPSTFKFEDKLFHWLIGVKCQNLCHLNLPFVSFNLSFYFKLLTIFKANLNLLCSLPSSCCYCIATTRPSFSANVISLLSTSTSTCQQNRSIWRDFLCHFHCSHSTCLLPHHILISTPFSHFHFPSTFSTVCLLTTQIKTLPPSHKL